MNSLHNTHKSFRQNLELHNAPLQKFYSIPELANRWRCSRGTVYNRLRQVGARILDFSAKGGRGKKVVSGTSVVEIENKRKRRFR
jgi:hypothetical protein